MSFAPRRWPRLPIAVLLLSAVGCSDSDEPAAPAVPTPSTRAVTFCKALHDELPTKVDGLDRHETRPASAFTAVWGKPAVNLRCGVPRPDVLTPGSEHYNPTADSVDVNGVGWLLEKQDDGYRFTTTLRKAYVEVTVPSKYAPEVNSLTDLAEAIKKAVPSGI
ncbi:DUF3515 domain-containing protein [Streptomyces zagrosensis]|uniref:DUF3515 domain-containing protein n=1 Tax=Streptomyces zagrosensis TaxID=1042984 RepID=A0A7W9Q989_9ACTN|nr:DUF3515 domain-containing protein [Streptomyces zagrosensis]MBB5935965.1 hypothetical protein [Streptomyces zagrosensis]